MKRLRKLVLVKEFPMVARKLALRDCYRDVFASVIRKWMHDGTYCMAHLPLTDFSRMLHSDGIAMQKTSTRSRWVKVKCAQRALCVDTTRRLPQRTDDTKAIWDLANGILCKILNCYIVQPTSHWECSLLSYSRMLHHVIHTRMLYGHIVDNMPTRARFEGTILGECCSWNRLVKDPLLPTLARASRHQSIYGTVDSVLGHFLLFVKRTWRREVALPGPECYRRIRSILLFLKMIACNDLHTHKLQRKACEYIAVADALECLRRHLLIPRQHGCISYIDTQCRTLFNIRTQTKRHPLTKTAIYSKTKWMRTDVSTGPVKLRSQF